MGAVADESCRARRGIDWGSIGDKFKKAFAPLTSPIASAVAVVSQALSPTGIVADTLSSAIAKPIQSAASVVSQALQPTGVVGAAFQKNGAIQQGLTEAGEDTAATLEVGVAAINGVETSILSLTPVLSIISPWIAKIPGESTWGPILRKIPIIGALVPQPPPPTPPMNYTCMYVRDLIL